MKIVDKIQKLLALTESSNEHEAALAAEKAHELLAEHNLSMAQVESASKKEKLNEQVGHTSATSKLGARWVRNLWLATARLYFCEYIYSRGNHKTYLTVIGSEANTTTACHMAEFFTQSVVEMSKGSSSQSSFRTGCALRLVARLNEMRKLAQEQPVTASNKSNLPALYEQTKEQLDNYISDTWGELKNVPSRNFSIADSNAYDAGRKAANSIGLNTQTTGTTNNGRALTNG